MTANGGIDYGTRARIGILLPSSNITTERQFEAMRPPGVSWHLTRLRLVSSDEADVLAMADEAEAASRLLADAEVDLIVFHCTAATTYYPGADDEIVERVRKATGIAAITTSKSVLAALDALGAGRIALLTPYPPHINTREVAFLARHGVEVTREAGLGIRSGIAMFDPTPEDWYRYAVDNRDADADAYFLSCAAVRATDVVARLEDELGRPVITSNTATAWYGLRSAGIDDRIEGFGTLLARH